MRNLVNTKVLVGLGAASLIAAGGSAFTGSNTLPTSTKAGYGTVDTSGITVSDIQYVVSTTDGSQLDKILFVSAENTSALKGTLTVQNTAGTFIVASHNCGNGVSNLATGTAERWTHTCDPADFAAVDTVKVGLNVVKPTA